MESKIKQKTLHLSRKNLRILGNEILKILDSHFWRGVPACLTHGLLKGGFPSSRVCTLLADSWKWNRLRRLRYDFVSFDPCLSARLHVAWSKKLFWFEDEPNGRSGQTWSISSWQCYHAMSFLCFCCIPCWFLSPHIHRLHQILHGKVIDAFGGENRIDSSVQNPLDLLLKSFTFPPCDMMWYSWCLWKNCTTSDVWNFNPCKFRREGLDAWTA